MKNGMLWAAMALLCTSSGCTKPTDLELAETMIGHGEYPAAIELCDRSLSRSPRDVEWLTKKGRAYIEMKAYTEAEETLLAAVEADPHKAEPQYELERLYQKTNDLQKAQHHGDLATRLDPKNIIRLNDVPTVNTPSTDEADLDDANGSAAADSWSAERERSVEGEAPGAFASDEDESEQFTPRSEPPAPVEPKKKKPKRELSPRDTDRPTESDSSHRRGAPRAVEPTTVPETDRGSRYMYFVPDRLPYRPLSPAQRSKTPPVLDEDRPLGDRSFSLSRTPGAGHPGFPTWGASGSLAQDENGEWYLYDGSNTTTRRLPNLSSAPTPSLRNFKDFDQDAPWRRPSAIRNPNGASTGESRSPSRMRTMVGPLPTAPDYDRRLPNGEVK